MKKRIAAALLLAVLVLLGAGLMRDTGQRLGCRIWADDSLIYEGTGKALEDIFVTLDLDTARIQDLRIEYPGPDGQVFPSVYLNLAGG